MSGAGLGMEAGCGRHRLTAWFSLAILWAGCSGEVGSGQHTASSQHAVCLPGQVDPCGCGPGIAGVSACEATGLAYGPCECPTPAAAGGQTPAAASPGVAPDSTAPGISPVDGPAGAAASGGPDQAAAPNPAPPDIPPPDPRARDIRITEVAMYQAVKVALARDGAAVIARNAPVITGKEAFLRVFVEPLAGFAARELEVELTLASEAVAIEPLRVRQRIDEASREDDLASTINFDLPPESLPEDVQWAVTLRELDAASASGMIDDDARFPALQDALEALQPRNAGPLRVMIVPYRYAADGSNRLPVVDEEQLEFFRQVLHAYYPVTEVQFEMHEPVTYLREVTPRGGWDVWLDAHCTLRADESPDPKLLYYGLIAPRPDARSYGSGIAGVSYLPGPAANYGRCSVGLGFAGQQAGLIMAHELGHSLGLPHAPCGVNGGPFPYGEAKIGSWGFGLESRTLKDPDMFHDVMSYCDPVFISDYNFQKLFERIRYLNLQFAEVPGGATPQTYLRVLQRADGSRQLMGRSQMSQAPGGDEERAHVQQYDAAGAEVDTDDDSFFIPMSEGDGGVWFLPDLGAASIAFDDGKRLGL